MPEIPFNFIHRRSTVSGYRPTSLKTGEIFIQQADKVILFKDDLGQLVCISTQTGQFVTTGQTGSFGGGNIDLSNYVLTGSTGNFVTTNQTGTFVTNGQTGVFALAANTGNFVTANQTGNFITTGQTGAFGGVGVDLSAYVTTGQTGSFVTTAQTGVFALAADTGSFVTTAQTGKFASLDGSNYLNATQIPNITGDVCIIAGSNVSTVYKIQGYPISNQAPVIGQTLQFDGSNWSPGSIPAGGNGGGGLAYYFNDTIAADLPTGNLPASLSGTYELGRTGIATQFSITTPILSQVSYDSVVGFVTDLLDPYVAEIPAGLFDSLELYCIHHILLYYKY